MTWQQLIQDRIYFDSVTGVPGTTWPIGTPGVPSDVIADVITLCTRYNILNVSVEGTLTLLVTMQHYCFFGNYHVGVVDVVDLNGQDVDNSRFEGLVITGAQAGAGYATYIDCVLYAMTGFRGLAENCSLHTSLAVATGDTDYADFDHCTSLHGTATVTIASPDRVSFKDFSGSMILTAQAAGIVLLRGFKGCLEIDAMVGGTLDIHADSADITINADCTAGTINIYGSATITDNSVIGCTVNDYTEQDDRAEQTAELIAKDMTLVPAFGSGTLADTAEQTLCSLDAIGGTKKDVKVTVYLAGATVGNIQERWYMTSVAAPATFVLKHPENAAHNPGAAAVLTREFGDLPEGLQLQFRIDSAGNDDALEYEVELSYLE